MSAKPQARNPAAAPVGEPLVRDAGKIRKLGIAELVLGSLVVVVGVVTVVLVFKQRSGYAGYGVNYFVDSPFIWCGAVTIKTGIWGVCLPIRPIKSAYIGNMIMGIICAITSLAAIVLSALHSYLVYRVSLVSVHAVMAVLNAALMVLSIAHAVLCGGGVQYERGPESVPLQTDYVEQQNAMGATPSCGLATDKLPGSMA